MSSTDPTAYNCGNRVSFCLVGVDNFHVAQEALSSCGSRHQITRPVALEPPFHHQAALPVCGWLLNDWTSRHETEVPGPEGSLQWRRTPGSPAWRALRMQGRI
ncbi:hypothetical protein GCM10019016_037320 [Streptomyces prasinosporus]|uniref:Uncharacterized protein n=1 Tax=Streptomyces prasinosporus TaxID=68256 RepID=A0ABP6TRA4_9ACTN